MLNKKSWPSMMIVISPDDPGTFIEQIERRKKVNVEAAG
jgi:hypothetical protein